jgi:hypothetical protein
MEVEYTRIHFNWSKSIEILAVPIEQMVGTPAIGATRLP